MSENTEREEVLFEAARLIVGDRNQTYGSPTENFQNTADMWNALLGHKLKEGQKITPTEVATLMIALKLARTVAQPKRDNFVDIAGYAGCGWQTVADAHPSPIKFTNSDKITLAKELWTGSSGLTNKRPPASVNELEVTNASELRLTSVYRLIRANDGQWYWTSEPYETHKVKEDGDFPWFTVGHNTPYKFREVRR
jgi:uncharacterized protein DUF6378